MSYTKTNWQTGDTITAEKLNHAEQGIYDNSLTGILIVTATWDDEAGTSTLNKTWQEIHDADFAVIYAEYTEVETGEITLQKSPAFSVGNNQSNEYFVSVLINGIRINTFYTDSSSGYPVYTENSGGVGGD